MKHFGVFAPTINDPTVHVVPADPNKSARESLILAWEGAKMILLIAVPVSILVEVCALGVSAVLPDLPKEINLSGFFVGILLAFLPILLILAGTVIAGKRERERMKLQQHAEELKAEADKIRAQAVRFEAEAKYIKAQAEAHPTVIATETVAIPQIGQARVTVHNEDKDAAYVEKVIEPPKLWTWKDREYKRDDLREFLKRSLPQPDDDPKSRKVRHSRRSWLEKQKGETDEQLVARQTLPSGDRIASQDKHNWYCEPFEYYGFLRGRGGETNSPGNWLTTDFDEICKIMKL